MITIQSRTWIPGVRAQQVIAFLLRCDDAEYQRWWPGTHLRFHTVTQRPGGLGNTVEVEELIGQRRVRGTAVVSEIVPGKKIAWRWKQWPSLLRLVLDFRDEPAGVRVTHTICAGFSGLGLLLDPFLRLFLSREFGRVMDAHVQKEFPRLAALLGPPASGRQGQFGGPLLN